MQIGPVLPLQLKGFPISNEMEMFWAKAQQKAANPQLPFSCRFIQVSHGVIEISLCNETYKTLI